jgi:hypothetical protein
MRGWDKEREGGSVGVLVSFGFGWLALAGGAS